MMITNNYLHILEQNIPFTKILSQSDKEVLSCNSRLCSVKKHALIQMPSDAFLQFIIILSGKVKEIMMCDSGKEICLSLLEKNDIYFNISNFINDARIEYILQAEVDSVVLKVLIAKDFYKRNASYIEPFMIQKFISYYQKLSLNLMEILGKDLPSRLAKMILNESSKSGSNIVSLSHLQFANYLNATREQVSRILGKLHQDGLIDLGYRKVIIKDFRKLEAMRDKL